jgi:hypothetical protein
MGSGRPPVKGAGARNLFANFTIGSSTGQVWDACFDELVASLT